MMCVVPACGLHVGMHVSMMTRQTHCNDKACHMWHGRHLCSKAPSVAELEQKTWSTNVVQRGRSAHGLAVR